MIREITYGNNLACVHAYSAIFVEGFARSFYSPLKIFFKILR